MMMMNHYTKYNTFYILLNRNKIDQVQVEYIDVDICLHVYRHVFLGLGLVFGGSQMI